MHRLFLTFVAIAVTRLGTVISDLMASLVQKWILKFPFTKKNNFNKTYLPFSCATKFGHFYGYNFLTRAFCALWLASLSYLVDIFTYLNEFNLSLNGVAVNRFKF